MYMSKFQNYNMPQYNKHGFITPQYHNWIKPNEIRPTTSEAEKAIDIEAILELPKLYDSEEGDGIKFEERPTTKSAATQQAQDLQGIFDVYKYIKKP